MLREHSAIFRRLIILLDLCVVAASFFIAYFIRLHMENLGPLPVYTISVLPVVVALWWFYLYVFGMYASFRMKSIPQVLFLVFNSAACGLITLGSMYYLFKWTHTSRVFVLLVFFIAIVLLGIEKIILINIFRNLRLKGFNFRRIIVVGTGRRARRFIRKLDEHKEYGLNIAALLDIDDNMLGKKVEGRSVVGNLDTIPELIKKTVIDQVIFIIPRSQIGAIQESVLYCETFGIRASVAVDHFELQFSKATQSEFLGVPLITFDSVPDKIGHLLFSRVINLSLSSISLVILMPLFILVGIAVKVTSRGPIIFSQERLGLNGRRFKLYKFRTMYENAESRLEQLRKYNEMQGPVFKMEKDPRVTPLGRVLRKLSIDELPQLWNVWIGDMNLVGPRPPLPKEVEQYDNWQRRRLSMRPGITGLWQVKGRNKIVNFDEWMRLDLQYIDNWSLWLDFKILLKTIPMVLLGTGAK